MAMHLRVVCPEHEAFDGEVAFVAIPSTDGEFGVLPRHASEICTIQTGFIRVADERMEKIDHEIAVSGGYVQVADDEVIVLAERADVMEKVDRQETQAQLEGFEEALRNLSEDDAHRAYIYNEIAWCKLLLGHGDQEER